MATGTMYLHGLVELDVREAQQLPDRALWEDSL